MKSTLIFRSAGLAATLLLSGMASADVPESESLTACVQAVAEANQADHLDVVRLIKRPGRGSFEYWMNADVSPAKKSYCRTQGGVISQIVHLDGQWRGASPARPVIQQTSGVATLCDVASEG